MVYRCEKCNRDFETEDALKQHNLVKHVDEKPKKKGLKGYLIFALITLIILFSVLSISSYMKKPGEYDGFAKCLTEKGAVIYGNDYCQYTNKQLNFFGKSAKYLNYVKCAENQKLCDDKNIGITPTWEINGEMYEQVQTFERLATISGCKV